MVTSNFVLLFSSIYISIYICNNENNVPSRLSPQWLCGNSCTWAHDVRLWCTSCVCLVYRYMCVCVLPLIAFKKNKLHLFVNSARIKMRHSIMSFMDLWLLINLGDHFHCFVGKFSNVPLSTPQSAFRGLTQQGNNFLPLSHPSICFSFYIYITKKSSYLNMQPFNSTALITKDTEM